MHEKINYIVLLYIYIYLGFYYFRNKQLSCENLVLGIQDTTGVTSQNKKFLTTPRFCRRRPSLQLGEGEGTPDRSKKKWHLSLSPRFERGFDSCPGHQSSIRTTLTAWTMPAITTTLPSYMKLVIISVVIYLFLSYSEMIPPKLDCQSSHHFFFVISSIHFATITQMRKKN